MASLLIYLISFLRPLETTCFTNTLLFGPQSITHIDLSISARTLATAKPIFRSSPIQEIPSNLPHPPPRNGGPNSVHDALLA